VILALTRLVPPSIVRCELTHLARTPIDVERAAAQHAAYERALVRLGCALRRLPEEPDLPDSVFVEDTAIVLEELAVIARPGAESRRGETVSVAAALSEHREVACIREPGTLDGGDVLCVGRRVYVGLSGRTNADGARQLAELLAPHAYLVTGVEVRGCLHLKSAVTAVSDDTLLVNPQCVDIGQFRASRRIEVDPAEPSGANTLRIEDTVVCAAAAPRTRERLERQGFVVESVDVSELAKAEAGVSCCSLIFYVRSGSPAVLTGEITIRAPRKRPQSRG
jgi:dimethylargininase